MENRDKINEIRRAYHLNIKQMARTTNVAYQSAYRYLTWGVDCLLKDESKKLNEALL